MENQEKALQVLLDAGIDENLAISMLKAMEVKPKAGKKKYYGTSTKRELITAPILVHQTCTTCLTETTFKTVVKVYSDETERVQHCLVSLCINCIKQFELMDKDQLISLIIIQNHPDLELRKFSTATQIKMAAKRSPQEWFLTKMNHVIGWGDKDKEGYVELPEPKE